MNSENFCYWLQGFFELTNNKELSEQQVQMIKNHLALVFVKVTPDLNKWDVSNMFDLTSTSHMFDLNTAYSGITSHGLCGESPLSDPNQRKYC